MNHFATTEFCASYEKLSPAIKRIADRAFDNMKADPRRPGVHLKQVGEFWSARAGLHYRALGISIPDGIAWFWIGPHAEYDKLIG